jgi:aspartate 1-decarboxylase
VLRPFLQAKIYPLVVTDKNLEYEGSIGVPRRLINQTGLAAGQMVLVVNLDNGERFDTYLIETEEGICTLNGGAARLGEVGDRLIIIAYAYLEPGEVLAPRILKLNQRNLPETKK